MKIINVVSPANIAFIKYWGQRDSKLVLPYNDSFSMNLSHCHTEIKMEVIDDLTIQEMRIMPFGQKEYQKATTAQLTKVTSFYSIAKKYIKVDNDFGFKIQSANTFPMKAGIASSAAFFSALALAFATAFNAKLDKKDLSILARLSGSGSASRSIPDGFSWWYAGDSSETSFAESIAGPEYWDIIDLVLVVSAQEKQTSSQEGHQSALTSPYYQSRQQDLHHTTTEMKSAFLKKDFTKFGTFIEQEAINFCSILMTQQPPLFYWDKNTIACMKEVVKLRQEGIESYFTIDAGANVHVICQKKNEAVLKKHFSALPEVLQIISNSPTIGAHV